uniref:Uncharacterized protein n=1 Tax=Globodera rostochiensis TaxID=31243 RepID=A0A914GUA0_GLORO
MAPKYDIYRYDTIRYTVLTNQSEPQANNKSQPKIKVELHEEQFDGRLREEFALKGVIKVEHEPHYGAVKVEGTVTIKHESADEFDQNNSKEAKQLSDQNNSTDQNESVDLRQEFTIRRVNRRRVGVGELTIGESGELTIGESASASCQSASRRQRVDHRRGGVGELTIGESASASRPSASRRQRVDHRRGGVGELTIGR